MSFVCFLLQENERLRDELKVTLETLRRDNIRLMHELVDTQRNYQDTLRASLSEQRLQSQLILQLLPLRPVREQADQSKSKCLKIVII